MSEQFAVEDLQDLMPIFYSGIEEIAQRDYKHALTGATIVLLSAALLDTTNPARLARFTRYPAQFIAAIAFNMQNNQLWWEGRYDAAAIWLHDGSIDDGYLRAQVAIALGLNSLPIADGKICADPQLYWNWQDRK